jgi:LacI family transcriptional regulator
VAQSKTRVTITAVAAHAGVSPATVSRVLNGNATVAADIAERVRASARELRYTASPVARSLVLGRTQSVACLVPDLGNPTFQGVLRGLSRAASGDRYRVLIADSAEAAEDEADLARELRRRCDALVLVSPRMPAEEIAALVRELEPVVLINRDVDGEAPVIMADYEAGIQPLAEHLYAQGHRRLAYVQGNPDSAANADRERGLATFLSRHPDVEMAVVPAGVTFEAGHDAAAAARVTGATGALAFNDLVAMGLLSGLAAAGVDVPREFSVTGFDDIAFARFITPPLTTASVPVQELGEQAWQRVHALIEGKPPAHNVYLRPRPIFRDSTAAPLVAV